MRLIVPDARTASALQVGEPSLPSEVWSLATRLDSPCIVLLSHPPQALQLAALAEATGPVLVQLFSNGVDHLHGLIPEFATVARAPQLRAQATAEVALTLALMVLLRADHWEVVRQNRKWEWVPPTPRLSGRRVFILGRGSVGSACSVLFNALGADVRQFGRVRPSLDDALAAMDACDVLVIALPLTPHTRGVVSRSLLSKLPDGAAVVNVARGPLIDSAALLDEVLSGRLRAGLDVFDEEPLPEDHPFWSTPGLILSPHVGGSVIISPADAANILRRQYRLISLGLPPENLVDPNLYRW